MGVYTSRGGPLLRWRATVSACRERSSLLKAVPWHTSSHKSLRDDLSIFCALSLHGTSSELILSLRARAPWFYGEHTRAASGAVAPPQGFSSFGAFLIYVY